MRYLSLITVYGVLIFLNLNLELSLPSTIYTLRSTVLCLGVEAYSYRSKHQSAWE